MLVNERPLVRELCPPPVHEAGEPVDAWGRTDRVAVVAHWSEYSIVSRSLTTLIDQLVRRDFRVIVSSTAETEGPLIWPQGLPERTCVYRRPNIGYDYGSWSQILDLHPQLAAVPLVLLANDSLVGPFRSLEPVVADMTSSTADVWALVSSDQDRPHFQSHFVAYRNGALQHPALREFWGDIRIESSKRQLILRNEIGTVDVLRRAGLRGTAMFRHEDVVAPGVNPTSVGWRTLLDRGFPFVKREIILRPPPEVLDAREIPGTVLIMFGQDVLAWV